MSKAKWRLLVAVCLGSAAVTVAAGARAQVGGGWQQYNPSSTIHLDGSDGIETSPGSTASVRNEGASFSKSGDVETFTLFDPISNRSERRMRNEYTGGRWQFEGEVRVSPPTNNESIMQIFGGRTPATTQMIRAYDTGGGTIRKIPGSVTLATGVHGRWVRINVIHDVEANVVRTYVDGDLKATGDGEAPSRWYHKYGCYGTLKTGSAKVEWRNVKHFRHSGNGDDDAFDLGEQPLPGETPEIDVPDLGDGDGSDAIARESFGCALGGGAGGGSGGLALLVMAVALALARVLRRQSA
jgi:hypothetical protein